MHIQQKPNCYSIQQTDFKKQLFWNSIPHLQITVSLPANLLHSQIVPHWNGSRHSVAFPGKEAHLLCPRPSFKRRFQSKNCFHSFSISQSCPRCSQELSCSDSRQLLKGSHSGPRLHFECKIVVVLCLAHAHTFKRSQPLHHILEMPRCTGLDNDSFLVFGQDLEWHRATRNIVMYPGRRGF